MRTSKIGFVSLGCAKNRVDTEVMLAKLLHAGYEIVEEDTRADVMIVNSCAFIQSAKEESIETVLDLDWLKKNHILRGIVLTGCMAQRYYEDIRKELPEVDAVVPVGDEGYICEAVEAVLQGKPYERKTTAPEELPLGGDRVVTTPPYTAYLKIAEGCDNCCAYCAIPMMRGPFRSRPMEDLIAEANMLHALGVKELCIIAQDTTRYGKDLYGEYSLHTLLEALCTSTEFSFPWIRLLYCYPDKITDELIEVMAKYDAIVKYIDMPIQHISDAVLKSMHRHGGSAVIKDAIARLRRAMPDIVIRTTALVGFPGETKQDFNELARFIKEIKFQRLGVFAYSREEGTPAYTMQKQVPGKIKQARLDNLMNEQYTIQHNDHTSKIGQTFLVLTEAYDGVAECYYGRSAADAPEIDGKVFFTGPGGIQPGTFVQVRIDQVMEYDVTGRVVSGEEVK
jgi:ribosomal protein S12 methylthiotransferase